MGIKKIYLIRHGQTEYNLRGIVQGSGVDTDLNDTGRSQVKAFFEVYKDIPFDRVYASALKRSQQSVQGFTDRGIPLTTMANFNEINWGKKEGQKITPEEDEYYHYMLAQWQAGNVDHRIEGGESPLDVVARLKPAMQQLLANADDHTILLCMHGRAMRVLLCHLLNYPLRCMDYFEHANLGLYVLHHTGTMFTLKNFNDVSHLRLLS